MIENDIMLHPGVYPTGVVGVNDDKYVLEILRISHGALKKLETDRIFSTDDTNKYLRFALSNDNNWFLITLILSEPFVKNKYINEEEYQECFGRTTGNFSRNPGCFYLFQKLLVDYVKNLYMDKYKDKKLDYEKIIKEVSSSFNVWFYNELKYRAMVCLFIGFETQILNYLKAPNSETMLNRIIEAIKKCYKDHLYSKLEVEISKQKSNYVITLKDEGVEFKGVMDKDLYDKLGYCKDYNYTRLMHNSTYNVGCSKLFIRHVQKHVYDIIDDNCVVSHLFGHHKLHVFNKDILDDVILSLEIANGYYTDGDMVYPITLDHMIYYDICKITMSLLTMPNHGLSKKDILDIFTYEKYFDNTDLSETNQYYNALMWEEMIMRLKYLRDGVCITEAKEINFIRTNFIRAFLKVLYKFMLFAFRVDLKEALKVYNGTSLLKDYESNENFAYYTSSTVLYDFFQYKD